MFLNRHKCNNQSIYIYTTETDSVIFHTPKLNFTHAHERLLTLEHLDWCWEVCLKPHTNAHGGHDSTWRLLWSSQHFSPTGPILVVVSDEQWGECIPSPTRAVQDILKYTACPADSISTSIKICESQNSI